MSVLGQQGQTELGKFRCAIILLSLEMDLSKSKIHHWVAFILYYYTLDSKAFSCQRGTLIASLIQN